MEPSAVLVTGGTGTLGRKVVERLRSEGRGVRVMSGSGRPGTVRGDLLTGEGIEEAVRGVDTVIHCATGHRKTRQTDIEGTELLLRKAAQAGISHVVYVSIVGVDRNPFVYYRIKRDAESVVERSGVPWTILRATQFHDLILMIASTLSRTSLVAPVPKGFLFQPIDAGEVADLLVELALSDPAGRVPDVGGPEVRTLADLVRAYLRATGSAKKVLELPLPGKAARAFREGAQVAPSTALGTLTWEEFLRTRFVPTEARVAGT